VWDKRGIPVEIRFQDDRANSVGDLYLDFPSEPLKFPCYALFLDPENALVLRTRPGRPFIEEGEIPGNIDHLLSSGICQQLMTSNEILDEQNKNPEIKGWVYRAIPNTERIGIASFIKGYKDVPGKMEPEEEPPIRDSDEIEGKIMMMSNEDSWGPITKEDPRIRVTIV
jgi:hypothetical protein